MSLRDQTIRFCFQASSELPTIIEQLAEIRRLTQENSSAAKKAADELKQSQQQTTAVVRASAQEQLAITREIAKQTTLERQAELDTWIIQIKASEERLTSLTKTNERERLAIASEIAKQTTLEKQAELRRQEADLLATYERDRKLLEEALARQLADYKTALRERERIADAQRAKDKADLEASLKQQTTAHEQALQQQTNTLKAEGDQQTAIVRGEQQRQTATVRAELQQQTAALRSQTNVYRESYSEVRNLIAAAFGVQELVDFGKAIIDAKSKVDIFKNGLTQMIGSQIESAHLFEELGKKAVKSPFEVEDLLQVTMMLKGVGIATQDLLPTIDMLGEIAAVVGTAKLPLIAKAFTDVQSKGKLMKQELNQFAENGVDLYSALQKSMNKTREEVIKMAADHVISFADVKKALMDATHEGGLYYGQMAVQSATLGGQVSNLSDLWFIAKAKIGDYYENGLKKVISGSSSLISTLAGSNAALDRTTKLLQAGTLGYTSYVLLTNRATLSAQALAAAQVVGNGVTAAGTLITGTYNLSLITMAGSTDGFTAAQIRSAAAARSTWAVLAANPLLATIAVIGLAVAAWKTYEAVTTDLTKAVSDGELALLSQQKTINDQVEAASMLELTDKRRIATLNALIQKYPDYFAGLDAEKTSNRELKGILDTVNGSFERRITLARAAYNQEENDKRLKDLFRTQDQLMAYAEQRLGKEFVVSINGDPAKLKAALDKSEELTAKFNGTFLEQGKQLLNGQVKNLDYSLGLLVNGFEQAKAANEKSIQEQQSMVDQDVTWRVAVEDKRNKTVLAQLKKAIADNQDAADDGDKKAKAAIEKANAGIQTEIKRHQQLLQSATGEHTDTIAKIHAMGAANRKAYAVLTAAQISVIVKEGHDQTVKQQIEFLNAQEKAEIEAANKRIVGKKASAATLKALEEQVAGEVAEIHEKYEKKRQQVEYDAYKVRSSELGKYLKGELEAISTIVTADQDKVAVYKKNQKEIADAQAYARTVNKETAQIEKETTEQQHDGYRKTVSLLFDIAGQATGLGGIFARAGKLIWESWDTISGKTKESLTDALSQARINLDAFEKMGDVSSAKGIRQLADLKKNVAESEQAVSKFNIESVQSMVGIATMAYQVLSAIADAVNEMLDNKAMWQQLAESTAAARQTLKDFYEFSKALNKEALDFQLENYKGTYSQQIDLIENYYRKEKELAGATDRADGTLAYFQKIAEIRASDMETEEKMLQMVHETAKYRASQGLQERINQAQIDKERIRSLLDVELDAIDQKYNAEKDRIEAEIDAAKEASDVKKALIEKERDARKEALEAELAELKRVYDLNVSVVKEAADKELELVNARQQAERDQLKATYDLKAQLLAQATDDQVEEIKILDRVRNEALERYRVDEVARLTATRDRILATLTDEDERRQVTEDYARQIQDVHNKVEDAKLDKTKGVTLATEQLREEEKKHTEKLKEEESARILELETKQKEETARIKADLQTTLDAARAAYEVKENALKAAMIALEADTKSRIEALQAELKNTILGYQNQLKDNELSTAYAKEVANRNYLNAIRGANEELFNATRDMKIMELRAQLALVRAMGGRGAAVSELEGVISMLGGQKYDPGEGQIYRNAASAEQQVALTKTKGGDGVYRGFYDAQTGDEIEFIYNSSRNDYINVNWRNPDTNQIENVNIKYAQGYAPKTGKRYATGTEYVLGDGYPDGIDTVPAMVNKGERIIDTDGNRAIERAVGRISNAELVRRLTMPAVPMPALAMRPISWEGMSMPAINTDSSLSDLTREMVLTRQAIGNLKQVNVSIDRNGFAVSEAGQGSIIEHWSNIFARS